MQIMVIRQNPNLEWVWQPTILCDSKNGGGRTFEVFKRIEENIVKYNVVKCEGAETPVFQLVIDQTPISAFLWPVD